MYVQDQLKKTTTKDCTILPGYSLFDIINTMFPYKTLFEGGNTIRLEGFGMKHALEIVWSKFSLATSYKSLKCITGTANLDMIVPEYDVQMS